jgi:protease-4
MAGSYRKGKEKEGKEKYLPYVIVAFLTMGFVFLMVFGLVALAAGTKDPFGKCVGVVEINGMLVTEETPASIFADGMAGSYSIAQKIEKINERDDIGAVVFVINSPGGSVVASEEIYRAIDALEKPKVAYFREVAASGGYYIATPADCIISEPSALTGSIGVIMSTYEVEGLMDKLGIKEIAIKSGEMKDMGSPFRNMTEEEKEVLGDAVEEIFSEFKSVILLHREGRLNMEMFEKVTDGRVLTGRMALEAGLVDEVGTREDAIERAAELGGIPYEDGVPACTIDVMGAQAGLFDMGCLLGGFGARQPGYRIEYR